jgi:tetratricopeptide (TPR) repeat protein
MKGTVEELARAALKLGVSFKEEGRLDEAAVCLVEALSLAEQGLADDGLAIEALGELVFVEKARGRLAEAERLLRRRIALVEQRDGDAYDGEGLTELAHLCGAQGRGSEGEELLRRAIALKEQRLGPDHFDVAIRLGDLCELFEARDRFAEARPLRERMIVILANVWGPFDPQLAPLLEKLAADCDRLGDTAAAAEHRHTASEIRAHASRPRN